MDADAAAELPDEGSALSRLTSMVRAVGLELTLLAELMVWTASAPTVAMHVADQ
jgi:hypothetical protein